MIIRLYERSVWGKVNVYFRDAVQQENWTKLTGQKTIKEEQIEAMVFFGAEFEIDRLPENVR